MIVHVILFTKGDENLTASMIVYESNDWNYNIETTVITVLNIVLAL